MKRENKYFLGALLEHGCPNNWTFKNAFYFVGTVITTIGYGNVAPKTKYGKVRLSNFNFFQGFDKSKIIRFDVSSCKIAVKSFLVFKHHRFLSSHSLTQSASSFIIGVTIVLKK